MILYKKTLVVAFLFISTHSYSQQRFFAEKAVVSFFSDAVVEDISATNEKVTSIFDVLNGEVAYLMSIKDFQFPNKLMQVHFNEKYMESEKYPKSSFQGKITGFSMNTTGQQNVKATGKLTIHGVTKTIEVPGTVEVNGNRLTVKSKFMVKLLDYNIKVPQIVWQNIAQQVEVTMDFVYRPL
ncbi:MAG TPA: YceI family protein [Chryseolinea sp.]